MTIFAVVALAALGAGNGGASVGGGATLQPQPTVSYPIRFAEVPAVRIKKPEPTVSYPIRFPSPEGKR
jgi:hypothetical protein